MDELCFDGYQLFEQGMKRRRWIGINGSMNSRLCIMCERLSSTFLCLFLKLSSIAWNGTEWSFRCCKCRLTAITIFGVFFGNRCCLLL
jgi:hypothetical protein